jgi:hypothetical protein
MFDTPIVIMTSMKRFLLLLTLCSAGAYATDLATARKVYVLGMARGLDQYLANHLTSAHIFQVVTDPKLADVIFTDHLGEGFQAQLEEISPSPEPEEKPVEKKEKADKKADGDDAVAAFVGPTVNKLSNPANNSTFGRNKGNVFLVDAKSREVLWSLYEPSRGFKSNELDHTASEIVSHLKKSLNKK